MLVLLVHETKCVAHVHVEKLAGFSHIHAGIVTNRLGHVLAPTPCNSFPSPVY